MTILSQNQTGDTSTSAVVLHLFACFHIFCRRYTMYSRVVWIERGRETEGVVPVSSNSIFDNVVFYPTKNAKTAPKNVHHRIQDGSSLNY